MDSYAKTDALFRSYFRPLCLYALHYLGDVAAAEDVVAECFEALWERLQQGSATGDGVSAGNSPGVSNPRAWLYTAVRNASIDLIRKRRFSTEELPRDLEGVISDEDARDRSVVEARLWSAIDAMPKRRREIFLMAKRDGMSYTAIAQSLRISESTVRNTMEAALKSLRGHRRDILGFVLCL